MQSYEFWCRSYKAIATFYRKLRGFPKWMLGAALKGCSSESPMYFSKATLIVL